MIKSFIYAIAGVKHAARFERNFRIHSIATIATILFSLWLKITRVEMAIIVLTCCMVLFAEVINTAVEHTLDWLEPNHHDVVKLVNDLCAGAVLITAIGAVVVGGVIFFPYIQVLFK